MVIVILYTACDLMASHTYRRIIIISRILHICCGCVDNSFLICSIDFGSFPILEQETRVFDRL